MYLLILILLIYLLMDGDFMNKWKIYSIVVSVILLILIVLFLVYSFIFKAKITKDEAKNIAFEYVNLDESDVKLLSIKRDFGDREYEIKFYDEFYEYEIDINYVNGRINSFEKDIINNVNNNINNNISMTEEEAKSIAIKAIGIPNTNDAIFRYVRVDRENGKTVYEVAMEYENKAYEVLIDVDSKEVIKYSQDNLKETNQSSNNYIGVDRAKEIVLNHANLTTNDVVFKKVELDIDYGIATYEIEFYNNFIEYDYEVDAISGSILKFEKDK